MADQIDDNLTVYFRREYLPLRDANVGILTHSLHYGTGVFEGIRAHWNPEQEQLYVLRMRDHYERWKTNCSILQIDLAASIDELCEITLNLLRKNNLRTNVYIRPLAFLSAQRVGVHCDSQSAFAIVAMPFGEYLHAADGIHAGISSWRRIEDNAIPARAKICGAYVNSYLASEEARQSGFDEAILLNENGHVAEGATCNLFMVRKGELITPPVSDNVLEGITRSSVMELARRKMGLSVIERSIDRSELFICDELFFTGTAVGVAPVVRIHHRPVGSANVGPVTQTIRQFYVDAALGNLPAYQHWLTPAFHSHAALQQELSQAAANSGH